MWSRNSCGRPVVKLQQSPKAIAAPHGTRPTDLLAWKQEEVVLPLVIPLAVEVLGVGPQSRP